ncbi:CPCC family cysteine-rich protein [Xanthomonas sacchari]|uniref:CPCC family cysteine-rich protein n=1 Tax=Xanthomonas sacchari TaxID=56458 RepID=UPI003D18958C
MATRGFAERSAFEICAVCFWEEDDQNDYDADEVAGGPNDNFSLTQARANYQQFGALRRQALPYVRAPLG